MKPPWTKKPHKAARDSGSAEVGDGRARPENELEFGLGAEEERRARRDRVLEEHRETVKRLGE